MVIHLQSVRGDPFLVLDSALIQTTATSLVVQKGMPGTPFDRDVTGLGTIKSKSEALSGQWLGTI